MLFLYKVLLPISLFFLIQFNASIISTPDVRAPLPDGVELPALALPRDGDGLLEEVSLHDVEVAAVARARDARRLARRARRVLPRDRSVTTTTQPETTA